MANMEDWDMIFSKDDETARSFLDPSNARLQDDFSDIDDHSSFFKEYGVEDHSDKGHVDSAVDMDLDLDLQAMMETEADEDQYPRISPEAQEEAVSNAEYQFRSYNLRPTSLRDGKSVWITWLDTDDSGDYNPNNPEGTEEHMGRPLRRSNGHGKCRPRCLGDNSTSDGARGQGMGDANNDDGVEDDREGEPLGAYLSRLAARQRGVSITVTLSLSTPALHSLAASIPDNWPGAHDDWNTLSDEHFQWLANQINNRNDGWKPYNLRRRNSIHSEFDEGDDDDHLLPEGRISDPLNVEIDLRHHPAARGCKACREFQHECSLLADEHTWPCYTCSADGCDCELLTVPTRRRQCNYCYQKRISCSNVSLVSDPYQPCTECTSRGFACIAGPDSSSIRQRISYDRDYSKPVEPIVDDRRFVTCTQCRAQRRGCSLKSKSDMPPCASCLQENIACTFLPLKRKTSRSKRKQPQQPPQEQPPEGSKYIRTALNHPIHFLHSDEAECTWCTMNIGVAGRSMRDVLVTTTDDLSYMELTGGENADGTHSDYMCIDCTMDRIHIVGCEGHELRPMDNLELDTLDIDAMLDRMTSHSPPDPNDRWCALCPAPAFFECCTPQESDKWGDAIDPRSKIAEGCGLLLCEDCAISYGELGDLEGVIDAINDEEPREIWVLGLRPDAEFLKKEGLLVRNVMAPTDAGDEDAMQVYG